MFNPKHIFWTTNAPVNLNTHYIKNQLYTNWFLHIYHCNAAERAIKTHKSHFLTGLSSCNPCFPLRKCDRLLPQAVIKLNLLHNSLVNPKLYAYAFFFGNYDFNRCPLIPPGTHVVVHSKQGNHSFWGFHGKDRWTTTPALDPL